MAGSCTSYEEVALELSKELGLKRPLTRQTIAQTAKSGLRKIFYNAQEICPELSPKEILCDLCRIFGLEGKDADDFFKSFPKDILALC